MESSALQISMAVSLRSSDFSGSHSFPTINSFRCIDQTIYRKVLITICFSYLIQNHAAGPGMCLFQAESLECAGACQLLLRKRPVTISSSYALEWRRQLVVVLSCSFNLWPFRIFFDTLASWQIVTWFTGSLLDGWRVGLSFESTVSFFVASNPGFTFL